MPSFVTNSWAAERARMACLIPDRQIFSSATPPQTEHVEHGACDDGNRCAHDGRKAHESCWQRLSNAMMESLWATLKKELVHSQRFRTHDEARTVIFEWIEVWYQRIRIHGSLGYVSPEAFEATERVG